MQAITHNFKEIKNIISKNFVTINDVIQMMSEIEQDSERGEIESDNYIICD